MVVSLPFLDWEKPSGAAPFSAPRYQVQGVILATLPARDDSAARHGFYTVDIVGHEFTAAAASDVAHMLGQARIFERVYEDAAAFWEATAAVDLASVALDPSHWAATEAYSGPAAMDFLHQLAVRELLDVGRDMRKQRPCELLARVVMMLGPTARDATRQHSEATSALLGAVSSSQIVDQRSAWGGHRAMPFGFASARTRHTARPAHSSFKAARSRVLSPSCTAAVAHLWEPSAARTLRESPLRLRNATPDGSPALPALWDLHWPHSVFSSSIAVCRTRFESVEPATPAAPLPLFATRPVFGHRQAEPWDPARALTIP